MTNKSSNSIRTAFRMLASTLGAEQFTMYNNSIAEATSIHEAVFVTWFFWMWDNKAKIDKKTKKREMFLVESAFCKKTCLPPHGFRTIVKKWERLGIIETQFKGQPPKKYYHLKKARLTEYLTTALQGSNLEETTELTQPRRNYGVNLEET